MNLNDMNAANTLLMLPLEIRRHIYSHCLIHDSIVDIVVGDMYTLINGLLLTCRQTYQEAADYYFANNTFQISFIHPCYNLSNLSIRPLIKESLKRVQYLHIVTCTRDYDIYRQRKGDSSLFLRTPYLQQLTSWLTKAILEAKQGKGQQIFKRLTIVDAKLDDDAAVAFPQKVLRANEDDLGPYSMLLGPLKGRIGAVIIQQCFSNAVGKVTDEERESGLKLYRQWLMRH